MSKEYNSVQFEHIRCEACGRTIAEDSPYADLEGPTPSVDELQEAATRKMHRECYIKIYQGKQAKIAELSPFNDPNLTEDQKADLFNKQQNI
jgi:hypothetical protein